jgi:hypothetical protein
MSGNFVVPVNNLFIGQYYKSANQTAVSGSVNVTFDRTQTWNNGSNIIQNPGSTTQFKVIQEGLYQVEFALTVFGNSATWNAGKSASINLARGSTQSLLQTTITPPSGNGYSAQVVGTLYLLKDDILQCNLNGTLLTGTVLIAGVANVFDYNTSFTWSFIR